MWSGEMFGSSEEDDQDVLLALLCKQLTEGKSGNYRIFLLLIVITKSLPPFSKTMPWIALCGYRELCQP